MNVLLAGTGNVAVTNASSSRNSSNSLAQQNGSTALHSSSSRQQASTSTAMTTTRKAGLSLLDMPFEIVEKIVSYTGYKEVSNMRLVWDPLWCQSELEINLRFLFYISCHQSGITTNESDLHHYIEFNICQIASTVNEASCKYKESHAQTVSWLCNKEVENIFWSL